MMMEPAEFHSNPQTMETNQYQTLDPDDIAAIHKKALGEFRAFRDLLVEKGVIITTARGHNVCPDDIFCNNWVSSHSDNRMVLYPMLAENRRTERRPELLKILRRYYEVALDISDYENKGRFLESTGALVMDRVNRIAYCALSARADEELARRFAEVMDFDLVFFNTRNHAGSPVYHTDVLMFIGSGYTGICSECIVEEDRARVLESISATHDVIDLSMDQLRSFCGNALEVRGTGDGKMLAMSEAAYGALNEEQKNKIERYVPEIIHSDLRTIEKYGGGSARCMLLELY